MGSTNLGALFWERRSTKWGYRTLLRISFIYIDNIHIVVVVAGKEVVDEERKWSCSYWTSRRKVIDIKFQSPESIHPSHT